MDLGAVRKGVDMGPLAIRHAGLKAELARIGLSYEDYGDIVLDPNAKEGSPKLRFESEVNRANSELYKQVDKIAKKGEIPLILGGDHSIAAGSISAVSDNFGPIGVIWMDAHGDFNDENISPTGNMHGMPLSAVCGLGPSSMSSFLKRTIVPSRVCIIGARLLDPAEKIKLAENGVHVYSISDVHTAGMSEIMRSAIEICSEGTNGIHLSFDMDCLDPNAAPGVGTPVDNGLTLRETFIAMEVLSKSNKMLSMDVVETNPLLDIRNKTGKLAVEIISAAFGA